MKLLMTLMCLVLTSACAVDSATSATLTTTGSPAPMTHQPPPVNTATPQPTSTPDQAEACKGPDVDWSSFPAAAQAYAKAWNERDEATRLELLQEALGDGAYFAEPITALVAVGVSGISDHIADFQEGKAAMYFEPLTWTAADLHHERMRIPWRLCDGQDTWLIGVDVAVVDARGRLTEIADFFIDPAATNNDEPTCAGADSADWSGLPAIVRAYGDAWMATTVTDRMAIMDEIWAEDGVYVNPYVEGPVIGRAALSTHMSYGIGAGHYLEVIDWTDDNIHHDRLRIQWRQCCPTGASLLSGEEIGEIDADGRLRRVTSFWNNEVALPADVACD